MSIEHTQLDGRADVFAGESGGTTSFAARLPGQGGENRIAEIIRTIHGYAQPAMRSAGELLPAGLDLERSRLQHAVETLQAARRQLHEQHLANQEQQQRVIDSIKDQWEARRRNLEVQLAAAALHSAREELADERERMLAEVRQQAVERESEQQQGELAWERKRRDDDEDRRMLERDRRSFEEESRSREAEWSRRSSEMERQLQDVRRKLVQAELTSVRDHTEWNDERRQWQEDRQEAERIIRELLAELETMRREQAGARAA